MKSIIYQRLFLYKLGILLSYRTQYWARYLAVADLIPDHVRVVDYCCGDAKIYTSYLKHRNLEYLGVDFNAEFMTKLRKRGVPCQILNVRDAEPLVADYSLMMGSLLQFIPDHKAIVDKILAHTRRFIISEPVRNNTESEIWLMRKLAYLLNDPGDGIKRYRFTPASFKEFLAGYQERIITLVENGIEIVVVLKGDLDRA